MPSFRFLDDPPTTYAFTCAGFDEEKAVRAFQAVMDAIPENDKLLLREHWAFREGSPKIAVEDDFVMPAVRNGKRFTSLAMNVSGEGFEFRFAGRSLAAMTPILVETVIAHEIAHVVVWVEMKKKRLPAEEQESYHKAILAEGMDALYDWLEKAVDRRILKWNEAYDGTRPIDWLNHYLKYKAPPPLPQPESRPLPPEPAPASPQAAPEFQTGVPPRPGTGIPTPLVIAAALGILALVAVLLWSRSD
jgi:hypothetical protein